MSKGNKNKEIAFRLFNDHMKRLEYIGSDIVVDRNNKEYLLTFKFKENES